MSKEIEEIVEEFWKMLGRNQFVKSTNSVTGEVEEYPPAIVDMEATVKISGEFDKYAIDEWLCTTLEEVRREERERIIKSLDWRNRTDGTQFRESDDVVDWYDNKIQALTPTKTDKQTNPCTCHCRFANPVVPNHCSCECHVENSKNKGEEVV